MFIRRITTTLCIMLLASGCESLAPPESSTGPIPIVSGDGGMDAIVDVDASVGDGGGAISIVEKAEGPCDDGNLCTTDDQWQKGFCVGTPIFCAQRPANTCKDAGTLMVYSTPATCRAGQCVHVGQEKDCAKGCKDGACVEDLCLGVICDSPPVGSCLDETTLGYFQAPGICSEGVCEYLALEETCGFGCQAGACLGDPCLGKNCSAPPASACVDANTLRHYSPQGSCAAGACSYPPQDIACTFGCSAGACLEDPCLGVVCDTPPAQSCTEMMTLRTYQSTGTCTAGQCEYQELTQTCDLGCQGGACLEDPCTGVSCTNSPANYCNGSGVVKYALNGTCSAGACAYKKAAYPCEFGCKAGECQPDPCLGVVCIAPPTVCEAGGTVVTSFTSSCSAGNCFVVGGSTPCEFGCLAGKCNPF